MAATLPVISDKLQPKWPNRQNVRENHDKAKETQAFHFNKRHGASVLPELNPGDTVRIRIPGGKQWGMPGRVMAQHEQDQRSYVVNTEDGTYRRNRQHLQAIPD